MWPTSLWVLCQACLTVVYGRAWERNLGVCPNCGRHAPVDATRRIEQLLDPDSVEYLDGSAPHDTDPLGFVDSVAYPRRLAAARERTGLAEAVRYARGRIEGEPVVLAVMDFRFLGGSLGTGAGELVTRAAETALADRVPFVLVTASGGARMQEGALSLMQMAKTSAALGTLDEAGLLTVSVITDPTFGGVAASFATLADVLVAEPGARLGFAGRRVIEQTTKERLPDHFQTAKFLLERGFLDMVVPRSALRGELASLLRKAAPVSPPARPVAPDPVVRDHDRLPDRDAWAQVRAARRLDRPSTDDYLRLAFDDMRPLRGDRLGGDCPAIVAGLARLAGRPVAVIGHRKGHTAAELVEHNYGMPVPAGYRKAARVMRLAAKLRIPVVTLVDTPGAYPGPDAEERGQAYAIAANLRLMAGLPVPVVSVILGEGGSGGALGLAVADRVLMFDNAVYSVISPEGCAAILWQDPAKAPRAASALGLTARDLLRLGVVDGVLPEPPAGTGADPAAGAATLRAALEHALAELADCPPDTLVARRRSRFRRYGAPPGPSDYGRTLITVTEASS